MVHEPEPITLVGCAQDLHRMCGKQLVLCVCVCWGGWGITTYRHNDN